MINRVHSVKSAGWATSVAVLLLGLTAAAVHADTIYVCWDGSGDYLTIQEGIDAAQDGDEVVVCDGTYTGDGNRDLDFAGKPITVRSANGPDNCIIDCQASEMDPHRGFYFHSGETAAAVVQGLTIRNGYVDQDTPGRYGGGVYCGSASSPTLSNCTITANSVYGMGGGVYCSGDSRPTLSYCTIAGNSCNFMGAGVYCWGASPTLSNCTISENTAEDWGAGVHCSNDSSPTLTNCTITDNTCIYGYGAGVCCEDGSSATLTGCTMTGNSAHGGAAVYCYSSSPTLTNCVLSGNTATQGYGFGGAVFCFSGANPTLTDCTITGNAAIWGGGVFCEAASPTLLNCTIADNTADDDGGGVYCWENSSVKLTNCTITGNTADVWGGGVACAGSNPTLTNCTMTSNTAGIRSGGGAVFCEEYSSPTLINSILWNDSPEEIYVLSGSPVVTYCDIQDGWAGDGNIDQDPLFVDPDNDDYHLSSDSPCINAGSNYAPGLPDEDFEGNPRIQQCRVDMGAYESPYAGTFEDCNENEVDDDCDVYEGPSEDCNQNHVPDECDIADGTSDDYDLNGVPDECDPDCNENGIPDACDLDCATGNCASHPLGCGGSDDYDLNGLPDECDPDCNENGIPDACDLDCATGNCASHPIGCGGSADCNENGVPDECDIADGTSEDCQPNGVPDECDIADGTSEDANGNGIPDECEEACQANELAKLLPSDGAADDRFGCSVALDGNTAVISAHRNDDNGDGSGSAYVFRYDGSSWIEEAKLLASDGAAGDAFANSVGISGDTVVVGAVLDDDNGETSGSAYVFRYNGSTWVEEAKLLASDGAGADRFGDSVAIDADIAVVGADGDDDNGEMSGSAYVFRYEGSTWVEEAKLLPSDGWDSHLFGNSVAVSGDTVVVGAHYDDDSGNASGSAYVFRYDGLEWVEETKLLPSDGAAGDNFGWSVGLCADSAVIGAKLDDDNGDRSGSAYVFRYDGSTWVEEAKLLASDGAERDYFGCSVAISAESVVVGAYYDDDNGEDSGSAYVFRFDGSFWLEQAKLLPSDGAGDDRLGWAVAVSDGTAVIGAYRDDDNGQDSGSAYAFHGLSDCQPNGTIDICDIVNGTSEDCQPNGVPDECDIADGTSADCQHNGVPDECDIADGTSQDENGNGVPDECEEACVANELAKLLASDGAAGDWFGACVDISGDAAVIGAMFDDANGSDSGSAYVFRYDGSDWVEEAKLLASDGAASDYFGMSVAISGDTAVIGAYCDDDSGSASGSAYVFRYDGSSWIEEAKLLASDGAAGDMFGNCVAISGDTALIGAFTDQDNGERSGSAYVFRYDGSTWVEESKLLPADGAAEHEFGYSVAICGDTALIGAHYDGANGNSSGSAYVFRYDGSTWVQEAKLLPSDGAARDYFGSSVACCADTAVIGAYGNDDSGSASGSAYVFRYDPGAPGNWIEEAKLLASDGASGDLFGHSVGVSVDIAVIGAAEDSDNGDDSGSAYVFRYDPGAPGNWVEQAKLLPSDGAQSDLFGRYSLGISGDTAVIGASWDDDNGSDSGSAYVFHGLSDCQPNGVLDICDIVNGFSDDDNGNGIPDECECPGDLDGDGDTDHSDLGILLADWGCVGSGPEDCPGDLDGDFDTDHSDLGILLADWGCGT